MTRPELEIAPAKVADATRIARMSRELVEAGLPWAWIPERVAASVRSKESIVVVARAVPVRPDGVAGFGIMRYGDDEAHLDLLGVDPAHRREGLGRRIVGWLEKVALVAGITAVFLEVREQNHGARAFYERLGYRDVAHLAGYYQGRESAIRMGREIGCRANRAERFGRV